VEDDTCHRTQAVEIIGVDLQAQARAGRAGQAAKTDVLRTDFEADTVDPILLIGKAAIALAVHPLVAGRSIDQTALTGAHASAALHAIFPIDVLEALGRIAFGTDEYRPEGNVHAGNAADQRTVKLAAVAAGAELAAAIERMITAEHADIGLKTEGRGAVRCGVLRHCGGRQSRQSGGS
jgi:hypothetical protein